ncbi:MAG: RNA 2',3'-cyclic phosphodiesterase [Desulfobacterales bacterium]|nr:RNA 2',3'-cyclic phosphodiesterase [Desulfobacterales bacterium]
MSETFRAFVAIDLPERVRSALGAVQQELRSANFRVKWVRPASIHLTLKFLGDIDVARTEAVVEAMTLAANDSSPLVLAPRGLGVFPNARRPRVIWVGLGGQLDLLKSLQRELEARLADLGFPEESRAFKGHLTLGRVKGKMAAGRLQEALDQLQRFESESFEVDRIILFKSVLQPKGAVYTKVKQVNLD